MQEFDGATIFWLISLGMVAGGGLKIFLGDERGLGMITNLIGGVLGCLIVGFLAIQIRMPGSMILGLLGTMAILFLANVFFMEDEHEPHADEELA